MGYLLTFQREGSASAKVQSCECPQQKCLYTHHTQCVGSAGTPQTCPFIYRNLCHPLRSILEFSNVSQLLYFKLSQLSCWGTAGQKQEKKWGKGLKFHQGSSGWIEGKTSSLEEWTRIGTALEWQSHHPWKYSNK